ncbi:MAG: lysophospholipid acyltransferase family protein [Bacilli bacterium]|nr:lysophospholipid acyltransferase family protein [Bacilli bacterium]MDD4053692.1 lysophospholipid acyltransferase family protein [Bacilli bacterium]MDD4411563.1 lysophospholipid acyltransferase family protein [Bacilli bacterium]
MKLSINSKMFLTENVYKLVRVPVKPCVKATFRPIVLNADRIPTTGPVVFAPNHRETLDAFLVFCSIKQPVHWMALKRFFTGEDSIFDNNKNIVLCKMTAYAFRSIGAVPIIRDQDKNKYPGMDNVKSLKDFSSYLKAGGSIGIFPEGTTNKNPKARNLLPAKMSAFNLAKDGKSWIQPISIVWTPQNLYLTNKVIINFREPFKVEGKTCNDILYQWVETVNAGIEENKRIIEQLSEINEMTSKETKIKK